ncbi:C2 domain-containing protein / GRAM domain-containing protein isoform 1 [Hibiscus syriacus]|uniref:C2 domain-containing protein / GRAM domain-containing protein isoform 1 n=1 Tax=Hibiscus syriacus TaxID=106335 RepID=A0A6A2XX56_HIBSY|nr:C2 domain-containing protein / GRAM domain-containing protein isoform 1 [Hibiscus syriacus]
MMENKRSPCSVDHTSFTSLASKRQKSDLSIPTKDKKDKVGERIVTLQQLVSPYGKVQKLRNLLDQVMSKNVSKFSSSENLSFLAACDAQTSSAPSPTLSAGNGDTISARPAFNTTQQICEYAGDMVMPASAISSYGEAFHVPDIIESTVGLLSSAEVYLPPATTCRLVRRFWVSYPSIGYFLCYPQASTSFAQEKTIVENVPIQNEGNAGDKQALMAINSRSMKQHHQTEKVEGESSHPSRIATSEPNNATKNVVSGAINSEIMSSFRHMFQ